MSSSISVSVITPAYNASDFVERCLDSVEAQTFPLDELEHIVVDDGSTDDTVSVVAENAGTHVEILETEHTGPTRSLNYGIRQSNGRFVVVLDSDDEFDPTLVEKMYNILETNPNADFVYSDYWEHPVDGERFRVRTGQKLLNLITVGVMHRRAVLNEVGLFDPEMYFSEYDLLLRYEEAGYEGYHIDEPLFTYHRRADSQTGTADWIEDGKRELAEKFGRDIRIRDY